MKALRWVTGAVFAATLIVAYAADNRASAPAGQPAAARGSNSAVKYPSLTIGARLLRVRSFSINNGASTVGGHQVILNNVCSGAPTHCMASEKSSFQGAHWQVYSPTPSFTLSPSNGTKTVYFRIMNAFGSVSAAKTDTIVVDEPQVTKFAINNGAGTTISRDVTLNNTCLGSLTHYLASESSTFGGASWQPYSTAPFFTLSGTNGIKTVWFKVKNTWGVSAPISDTITLNEVLVPEVKSMAINNGAAATTTRHVTLNNICTNNPTEYLASENAAFANASWQPFSPAPGFLISSNNGIKTVWFKVRNARGESAPISDSISLNAPPTPPDMVPIPAGSFMMGNGQDVGEGYSDEHPLHSVYVMAFHMDRHEVTKALWDEVATWAAANGYDISAGTVAGKAPNHPVQSVTWHACVKWCNARSQKEGFTPCYTNADGTVAMTGIFTGGCDWSVRGYRLPTEAEWEKAARGGAGGIRFPWSDPNIQHPRANYRSSTAYAYDTSITRGYNPICNDSVEPLTSAVGSFPATGYGLYDMAGNVAEWCWDWFDPASYGSSPAAEPRGPSAGSLRVARGGSWFQDAAWCRAACRGRNTPDLRSDILGFRTVRPDNPLAAVSFAIDGGAAGTTTRRVRLNNTCVGSPTEYQAGEQASFGDATGWLPYSTAPEFVLSGTNGTKTVWFKVRRSPNEESTAVSDTIVLDEPSPPRVLSFAINDGATATTARNVTLNNVCTNGPTEYMASEDASFSNATWKAYSKAPAFTLQGATGTRTVWFKVRNAQGVSATASSWITLNASPTPPDMVLIPAGSFTMGNSQDPGEGYSEERPTHTVYVSAFYADRHEVTKALWDEVAAWAASSGYDITADSASGKDANHPVQYVTWHASLKWCNARSQKEGFTPCYTNAGGTVFKTGDFTGGCDWSARGYRLPTEAEWEKAARGGIGGRRFPWSGSNILHTSANYYSSTAYAYDTSATRGYHPTGNDGVQPYTSPVGTTSTANDFGLYDVAGNVMEWCWDWFDSSYYGSSPASDPRGPSAGLRRVLRGGSWFNDAACARVASRASNTPDLRSDLVGFRSVRSDRFSEPVVTSFAINGGADATTNRTVTLNSVCTGSPTEYMASENAAFSGASWQAYRDAPTLTLAGTNGVKTVWFKVRNAGAGSAPVSYSIILNEPTPAVTLFFINKDAPVSTSRNVTLNNACTGNPTEYLASENAAFSGASWQAYSTSPQFALTGASGSNTVWFKVRNAAGPSVAAVSDSIILDEALPPANMVYVPAGSFTRGNCMVPAEGWDDELPTNRIAVSAFYMDRYEVTKALWDEVATWAATNGYDIAANRAAGKAANHPAQGVSWYDCLKWCNARSQKEGLAACYMTSTNTIYKSGNFAGYCNWSVVGYRLPTEAEWEKGARGGAAGNRYAWSDMNSITHNRANYWSASSYAYDVSPTRGYHSLYGVGVEPYTSPAGSFAANGYELFDMVGNVWEWCWDWYEPDHYAISGTSDDPQGPSSGAHRVARGGSWDHSAMNCRVAARYSAHPGSANHNLGFRTVLQPSQP